MLPARDLGEASLEQRIGHALLGGRADEGVIAIEGYRIAACSPHASELLNLPPESILGRDAETFIKELDGDLLRLHLQSALLDDGPVEFVVQRPGREDEWIEVRSVPLAPGVALFLRDVTSREVSERSIRRKEQRLIAANRSLRLAHAAAKAASWEWRRGKALRWLDLPAARELEALPRIWTEDEEITDWQTVMPAEWTPVFHRSVRALSDRGVASSELAVRGDDGELRWLRVDGAVTERDGAGAPIRVSGVIMDVTQSRRAAEALKAEVAQRKRSEERQQLLVHELNHRVKNMLATVQSVARQSLAAAELSGPARDFEERLMALAWTYEILTREQWEGASIREVIERTMAPHAARQAERLSLEGPDLWLPPNRALSFALAFHELATNAVKYGALSNSAGRVQVRWRVEQAPDGQRLELAWIEEGGPPVVEPARRGFGSRLIERSLARELGGRAKLHFEPGGLQCRISALLAEPGSGGLR